MKKLKLLIVLFILLSFLFSNIAGAYIAGICVNDYSSYLSEAWAVAEPIHTIDGSGFNASTGTHGTATYNTMWQVEADDYTPYIIWDLGGICTLDKITIWNWNGIGSPNYGAKSVSIYTATDGNSPSWTLAMTTTLGQASGTADYDDPNELNMNNVDARLVKLMINTTYMSSSNGRSGGLSEVRFTGTRQTQRLLDVTVADFSSENLRYNPRHAVNTTNGSGLYPNFIHSNRNDSFWHSDGDPCYANDQNPWIVWDMGDLAFLDHVKIWNCNSVDGRWYGVHTANVYYSLDSDVETASWEFFKTITLNLAPGTDTYDTPDNIYLDNVMARHVKLSVISSHQGSGTPANSAISEVQFYGEQLFPIHGISVAKYSSEVPLWGPRLAVNTVNTLGFDPNTGIHDNAAGHQWQAADSDNWPEIVWDLKSTVTLDAIKVWNCNISGWTIFSVRDVNVFVSTSSDPNTTSWTYVKKATLNIAPGTNTYNTPDVIDMGNIECRLVKFKPLNSYVYNWIDGHSSSLSKVQFMLNSPMECGNLGTKFMNTDINHDCFINIRDLAIIFLNWLNN